MADDGQDGQGGGPESLPAGGEGAPAPPPPPRRGDAPRDARVICTACTGLGVRREGGEETECERCRGSGLVEPAEPARRGEESPGPEGDARREEPGPAAPRRKRRGEADQGFDVEAAPKRSHKAGGGHARKEVCRDPDCPDHSPAARQGTARKCVESGRTIYPRMSDDAAARLASGILTSISMGVSMATQREVRGPLEAESARLGKPLGAIVQRYLGSLGAHADVLVLVAILIAYGRARVAEASSKAPGPQLAEAAE